MSGYDTRLDPLTTEAWFLLRDRAEDCTCAAPECAMHRDDCAVTPIYAQTFADTSQPRSPWAWPWLVIGFPECSCDDEPQFCEIHGEPEWMRRYAARWV